MITFTLPGIPPSANMYWRHNQGRTHISEEGIEWREYVAVFGPSVQLTGDLFLDIALYLPDRRRDPDNKIKSMQDSLQYSRIVKNDRQIRDVRAHAAGIDKENPRTVITLGALEQWPEWIMKQLERREQ